MKPTIVLVHGLAITRRAAGMFTGVADALAAQGHRVERTVVQGDGSLEELADRLWKQLDRFGGDLVLLCHSMGGLQSRTFLLDDRRAERLRAIATVGSPHAGTPLASAAFPFGRAYRALTLTARRSWQQQHAEEEQRAARRHGVRILSAVAATPRPRHLQLVPCAAWLQRVEGPNDGLVGAGSQRFGEVAFETTLDHVECAAVRGSPEVNALWLRLLDAALENERPGS